MPSNLNSEHVFAVESGTASSHLLHVPKLSCSDAKTPVTLYCFSDNESFKHKVRLMKSMGCLKISPHVIEPHSCASAIPSSILHHVKENETIPLQSLEVRHHRHLHSSSDYIVLLGCSSAQGQSMAVQELKQRYSHFFPHARSILIIVVGCCAAPTAGSEKFDANNVISELGLELKTNIQWKVFQLPSLESCLQDMTEDALPWLESVVKPMSSSTPN